MVTQYGTFPGVRVEVSGGGITAVAIGDQEKLVVFGAASYQNDDSFLADGEEDPLESTLSGSLENPETINARREADTLFGGGSELADGMREALANGANINFLYGVAPRRFNVVNEVQGTQSGTLAPGPDVPIWEQDVSEDANITNLEVTDSGAGTVDNVRYTYESPPTQPSDAETVVVNPLTREYAADATPDGDYNFSYKYLDWESVFDATSVKRVVNEDETGIYDLVTESDKASIAADSRVSSLRGNYRLINVLSGAEPNSNEMVQDDSGNYLRYDARYDTGSFTQGSVDSDYYFKAAPVRQEDTKRKILGGVGGLFAGNPIDDPIYNDVVAGYSSLEQSFSKGEAEDMRGENVIPVREAGSIRVKDNISTSTETDWERDFWRRRIADRVILIAKTVGDTIIGRINDNKTQNAAGRLIRSEIRELVEDRLLRPNTDTEQRWFVDVSEDSTNSNQVNIDIGFTPYGIVKRVEETITIDT